MTPVIRTALAEAPIGAHAMLEAAFAWHLLRPGVAELELIDSARPRHLPVAETDSEEVAVRLARLLSGLAWAVITDSLGGLRVEVPRTEHNRVIRALTAAWRQGRREFDPATRNRTARKNMTLHGTPGAAAALWRMGLLIGGPGPAADLIYLRTRTAAVATMLRAAAATLGVNAAVEHIRGDPAVVVSRASDVRRLLTETGAGDRAAVLVP